MAITDVIQKSRIYHTLSELNNGVCGDCGPLRHIAANRIIQIKSGKTVFQFHARAAGRNQPGISRRPASAAKRTFKAVLWIARTLKGKHKVPPSYSRAGKGARSLNGRRDDAYKKLTLTLKAP
jgi:hypothetical protein